MAGEDELAERQGLMPMASPPSDQVPQSYLMAGTSSGAARVDGPMGKYRRSLNASLNVETPDPHSAVSSDGEEGHFLDAMSSPFDDPRSIPLPLSARTAASPRSSVPGPMQRAQAEGLAAASAASASSNPDQRTGTNKGRLSALMSALGGSTDSSSGTVTSTSNNNKEAAELLPRRASQQSLGGWATPPAAEHDRDIEAAAQGGSKNFLSYPPVATSSASPRIRSGDMQAIDDHTLSPWNGFDSNGRRASSGAYLPPRPGSTGTRTPGSTTPTRRLSGVGGAVTGNASDGLPLSPDDLGLGVMMPSLVSHYLPEKVTKPHRQGSRRHRGTSAYGDEHQGSTDRLGVPDESGGGSGSNTPRSRWSAGAFRRKGNVSNPASPHADTLPHRSVSQGTGRLSDPALSPVVDAGNNHLTLSMPSDNNGGHPPLPSPSTSVPRPLTKFGAGRAAWGPDGAGKPELGAGDFEDDDGVEVNNTANNGISQSGRSNPSSSNGRVSDEEALTGDAAELHRLAYGAADAITGNEGMRRRAAAGPSRTSQEEKDDLVGFSDANVPGNGYGQHQDDEDDNTRHLSSRAILGGGLFSRIFAGFFLRGKKAQDGPRRLRWNKFKWALFLMNVILTIYAIGGLIGTLLTWANVWESSDVIREANDLELKLATVAAGLCFVTAILGWAGVLLNNRAFLAFYNLLLWICFAFIVAPGYITYKKRTFNLEGKMNYLWSRDLNQDGRRTIQNSLSCCGYYNPFIEAAASSRCYARSTLPGCKGRFIRFERDALEKFYAIAFALVAPHLILIVTALLSSNHVTYRFGKGLTPTAYRLDEPTAKAIQLDFLAQLKSMYGPGVLHSLQSLHQRRVSKAPSSNSYTYLLDNNGGSPAASADGHLEPPNKGALFKERHDSFSTEGSSGGSPLRQSLGAHDLLQDGSALDTPDEKTMRR